MKPAWVGGRREAESSKGEREREINREKASAGNMYMCKHTPEGQSHQSGSVGDPKDKGRKQSSYISEG